MYTISGLGSYQGHTIWNAAENYLNVFGKRYQVIHITKNQIMIKETKRNDSYFVTALKILSYATIILPAIAYFICQKYRATHEFVWLKGKEENYERDLSKIADEAKKVVNTQVLPYDQETHRFDNVLPPKRTLLWVSNQLGFQSPLHANTVTMPNGHSYIAAQAPHNLVSQELFWRCCVNCVDTIVDLTQDHDDIIPYYPSAINECYKIGNSVVVQCSEHQSLGENLELSAYQVKVDNIPAKQIRRIHYDGWPDHNATTIQDLAKINRVLDQLQNPKLLVHCRAGVGRTGTFIIFHYIHQIMNQGKNIDYQKIKELVLTGKISRGSRFVENKDHLRMLHCYANQQLKVESQKSKVKSQKSKVKSQKSKVESRKSKVESPKRAEGPLSV